MVVKNYVVVVHVSIKVKEKNIFILMSDISCSFNKFLFVFIKSVVFIERTYFQEFRRRHTCLFSHSLKNCTSKKPPFRLL